MIKPILRFKVSNTSVPQQLCSLIWSLIHVKTESVIYFGTRKSNLVCMFTFFKITPLRGKVDGETVGENERTYYEACYNNILVVVERINYVILCYMAST